MKAEKTTLELVKLCMEKWRICNISSEVAYQCKWHVFLYSKVKKKKYFQQAVFVSFVVFLNNTRVLRILSERTTKNQEEGAAQSLACPRQLWVISSEISPSAEAADSNQSHPKGKRFLKDKLCKIWQKLEWGWGKAWSFMFFAFYNCCFLSKVAKFIEFRVQSSSAAPPPIIPGGLGDRTGKAEEQELVGWEKDSSTGQQQLHTRRANQGARSSQLVVETAVKSHEKNLSSGLTRRDFHSLETAATTGALGGISKRRSIKLISDSACLSSLLVSSGYERCWYRAHCITGWVGPSFICHHQI